MNPRRKQVLCTQIMAFAFLLTGCAGFDGSRDDMTTWGVKSLVENQSFQKIDLAQELDPAGQITTNPDANIKLNQKNLRLAFNKFYIDLKPQSDNDKMLGRNRVQERILGASQDRCNEYFTFLDGFDAETNFMLGSLTTAVAGAGAIFTQVDTVRALSGIAAIFSGVRSEFNEDYFANQTIEVIRKGIEARRAELYRTIKSNQSKGLSNYTVEEAIKDAIDYHGACSLTAGLLKLGKSLERVENPGLKDTERAVKLAQKLNKTMGIDTGTMKISGLTGPVSTNQTVDVKAEGGGVLEKAVSTNTEVAIAELSPDLRGAKIKGVSPGETIISFEDLGGKVYNLAVKVENKLTITGDTDFEVGIAKSWAVSDLGAKSKSESTNSLIATFDKSTGQLNPKSPGRTLITITNDKGQVGTKWVKVQNGFKLDEATDEITLIVGGPAKTVKAQGGVSPIKTLTTNSDKIAEVDTSTGQIKAASPGIAVVTFTDNGKKAGLRVKTENAIAIHPIKATLDPNDPSNNSVTVSLLTGGAFNNSSPKSGPNRTITISNNEATITALTPGAGTEEVITFSDTRGMKASILITITK